MEIKDLLLSKFINNRVNIGCKSSDNDPCMLPFLERTNKTISSFNLVKTFNCLELARNKLEQIVNSNDTILFISPEHKFDKLVKNTCQQLGMPFIIGEYPKNLFENICLINSNIKKIDYINELKKSKFWNKLSQFEKNRLSIINDEIDSFFKKKHEIKTLPKAIFIIDPLSSYMAIDDAQKYDVKIFSIVNSNSSPLGIDYFIPANNMTLDSVHTIFKILFDDITDTDTDTDTDTEYKEHKTKYSEEGFSNEILINNSSLDISSFINRFKKSLYKMIDEIFK